MKIVDVAIVGAGLAGVAAAGDLTKAGKSVLLIDKSRGVGGRMATRRHDGARIDHGAQFFTARTERFQSVVDALIDEGVIKIWSHGFPILIDGEVVSRPDGHPRYACIGGMNELAKAILPSAAELLTNTEVTEIKPVLAGFVDGARYEVLCGESTVCLARDVVLNMPPPQVMKVAAPVLGDDDIERLTTVAMEPCWAMGGCLTVDIPLRAVAIECQHDVLGWISRNHTRRGASDRAFSIMVHASGSWSAAHIEDDKAAVRAALESAMAEIGMPLSWESEPFIHRWRYAKPQAGLNDDYFAATESPGVYGIGDWCKGGRVEGAICSGWDVAKTLGSRTRS